MTISNQCTLHPSSRNENETRGRWREAEKGHYDVAMTGPEVEKNEGNL